MEVLPINLLSFIQEAGKEKDLVPWLWVVTVPGQSRVWKLMTSTSSLNMVEFILTPGMLFNLTWPFNARVLRWLRRLEVLMFQWLVKFPHLPGCVVLGTLLRCLFGSSQTWNLPLPFPFLNNLTLDLFSPCTWLLEPVSAPPTGRLPTYFWLPKRTQDGIQPARNFLKNHFWLVHC